MTPTISTSRLSLRPLTKVARQNMAWLRDPEVVKYSELRHGDHTLSTQLRYINSFVGSSHIWAIHRVESGDHIGNLTATTDAPNNVSDVGIMIGEREAWGKGYGMEAWRAACEWLLRENNGGGIRKLEAGCMRSNTAMVKIIQGSGFTQEGERLNHFKHEREGLTSMLLFGRAR